MKKELLRKRRAELKVLAKKLLKVPKRKFDMNNYGKADPETRELKCGTTACAMGWYVIFFPKSKLKGGVVNSYDLETNSVKAALELLPRYLGKIGYSAIASYFDMGTADTEDLFGYVRRTPQQESKVILKWLKENPVR